MEMEMEMEAERVSAYFADSKNEKRTGLLLGRRWVVWFAVGRVAPVPI